MKYEKCVTCQKLDQNLCNGPNFSVLNNEDKTDWMIARAKFLGLTHKAIAEKANIPKGTVDPILAKKKINLTSETFRMILAALGVNNAGDHPCPDATAIAAREAELAAAQDRIKELEAKLAELSKN